MLWLIIGLIVGVGGYWLVTTLYARDIRVMWYEWLIALSAVVLALLAIQNFVGSLEELEPQAAWMTLVMFGVPALVLAGIAAFLVRRRQQPAKPAPQKA